jgi:hypothetical protein
MPDKNFKSYETFKDTTFRNVELRPANPAEWNDTMKVRRCNGCTFDRFDVLGSREDCVDVGQATNDCLFDEFVVEPTGQYVVTCKGGSNDNVFRLWLLRGHGKDVDFEFGNWHTYNFERSTGNVIEACRTTTGRPITYCYRFGCKPIIIDTHARHLWWRSIGVTVYWWAKFIWHRVLNRPDNF